AARQGHTGATSGAGWIGGSSLETRNAGRGGACRENGERPRGRELNERSRRAFHLAVESSAVCGRRVAPTSRSHLAVQTRQRRRDPGPAQSKATLHLFALARS